MRAKKSVFAIVAGLIVCVSVVWYSTLIEGSDRTYRIRPEIRVPEYRTDAARAIDAYERLMDRYMTLTERNLSGIKVDMRSVAKKLESIDGKLTGLSIRMARIEKALGIEPPKKPVPKILKPKTDDRNDQADLKSSRDISDDVSKDEADSYSL